MPTATPMTPPAMPVRFREVRGILIVIALVIMAIIGALIPHHDTTSTPDRCETLWLTYRNSPALAATAHSDYVRQCRSDERRLNQLSEDHS